MLPENMQTFLTIRPKYKSDADAARAMGLKPATVYKWNFHKDPEVRAEYMEMYTKVTQAKAKALSNIENVVSEELRTHALDRYRELLRDPITDDTTASERRVIRDAAKDVLEETGDLGTKQGVGNALQMFFTQINVDSQGQQLRPGWLADTEGTYQIEQLQPAALPD